MIALSTWFKKIYFSEDPRTVYLNTDGSILSVPEVAFEKRKIKKEQLIGRNFRVLFDAGDESQKFFNYLLDQARVKGSVNHHVTLETGRKSVQAAVKLRSVRDEKGEVIGYTVLPPSIN